MLNLWWLAAATLPIPVGAPPAAHALTADTTTVTASAPLGDGSNTIVQLTISGDDANLWMRGGRYDGQFVPVSTVDIALLLLADQRLEPLWPALSAWAGPGLERLRDRQLGLARAIAESGQTDLAESTVASITGPKTRATMMYAEGLQSSGQLDKAIELIRAARGSAPGRGKWNEAEWMALSMRLTTLIRARDGFPAALEILDESERLLGRENPLAVNFQINRAAFLAEARRPMDALAELDRAEAAFRNNDNRKDRDLAKVPGSDRQFAWIRICALTQLGRHAEVQPLMDRIYPVREPSDDSFIVTASEPIRLRLFRCTGDAASAASEYARDLRRLPFGGAALLTLQPAYSAPNVDAAFMRRIAAEPEMVRALAGRLRPLPQTLVPALNHWRGNPSAVRLPTQ